MLSECLGSHILIFTQHECPTHENQSLNKQIVFQGMLTHWTKKIIVEDGHTVPQLVHILQLVVRHFKVYYPVRHHLIQHMVNSLQKLGFTASVCIVVLCMPLFSSVCLNFLWPVWLAVQAEQCSQCKITGCVFCGGYICMNSRIDSGKNQKKELHALSRM